MDISSSHHDCCIPWVGDVHPPSPASLLMQNGLAMKAAALGCAGRAAAAHPPSHGRNPRFKSLTERKSCA